MRLNDPLAHLQAGHRRLEQELQALEGLGEHVAQRGADALAQMAARGLLDYFDGEAALHHADEDEDLFPLLRGRAAAAGRSEIAAALDEMEREHGSMEALWRRLRDPLAAIAAMKARPVPVEEVTRFAWLYRRHMEREELLVVPFAREALSAQDLAALAKRMARRRGSPQIA